MKFTLSAVLDDAATGWEKALTDATGNPIMGLPVHLVSDQWDATRIAPDLLPVLAYSMGINLYEEAWSLDTKRQWVANNWNFLRLRGTIAGVRMALAVNGFDLVQYVAPPQGFFASPEATKEEMDAWLEQMPEVRITFKELTGEDNGQFFAGDFADDGFAALDDGDALRGTYAFLRQRGVVTPLRTVTLNSKVTTRYGYETKSFSTEGLSTLGFFADDFADDASFVDAEEVPAVIYTMNVPVEYERAELDLAINTLTPGLTPIDMRVRVTSDYGSADCQTFADDCHADEDFAGVDDAALLLARSVFLFDPNVEALRVPGASFADADRVGMELRTVEMLVDLHQTDETLSAFADDVSPVECFSLPMDTAPQDRAIRAIEAARGALDRVLVRFDHLRPLAVGDNITEETKVGDWVKDSL